MTPFNKFKNDYQGKAVLILGLGVLGGGAADAITFAKIGAKVTVTDLKTKEKLSSSLKKLKTYPIKYVLGRHREKDILANDLIIRSPAVPEDSPFLALAYRENKQVKMSDALFLKYITPQKVIGITGTRGKTTTTMLIFKILKTAGLKVFLGGNIPGVSSLSLLLKLKNYDWIIMELSSWQLQGTGREKLSPHLAVITNIYPDHLNRYRSMKDYLADKEKIFAFQAKNDFLIANKRNKMVAALVKTAKSRLLWFSENDLPLNLKTKLLGRHNRENISASLKVAQVLKIPPGIVARVISNFSPVPYRLEKVATVDGVAYVNDTTSTTPIATIRALETATKPIILISGGASKNLDLRQLARKITLEVKAIILLEGTATDELQDLIIKKGGKEKIWGRFASFSKALRLAAKKATKNETVLLSPGCASFGMFENEFDRGDQFNKFVNQLLKKNEIVEKTT